MTTRVTDIDFVTSAATHTATLSFNTGETVTLDFRPIIDTSRFLAQLADPNVFAKAKIIDAGIAVGWPGDLDMDAESMRRTANVQAGRSVHPEDFRAWRKDRGLTQVECGKILGITARAIQLYESGVNPVPPYITLALKGYDAILAEAS